MTVFFFLAETLVIGVPCCSSRGTLTSAPVPSMDDAGRVQRATSLISNSDLCESHGNVVHSPSLMPGDSDCVANVALLRCICCGVSPCRGPEPRFSEKLRPCLVAVAPCPCPYPLAFRPTEMLRLSARPEFLTSLRVRLSDAPRFELLLPSPLLQAPLRSLPGPLTALELDPEARTSYTAGAAGSPCAVNRFPARFSSRLPGAEVGPRSRDGLGDGRGLWPRAVLVPVLVIVCLPQAETIFNLLWSESFDWSRGKLGRRRIILVASSWTAPST